MSVLTLAQWSQEFYLYFEKEYLTFTKAVARQWLGNLPSNARH